MTKLIVLQQALRGCASVCIGYSGGVDSVFLAVTAIDTLGARNVLAITGRSASYPDVQWQSARAIAQQFGIPHLEIDTDEMNDANYTANPSNRCYFCKTELWSKLAPIAQARGFKNLLDGANADDAHDYRPGARAAREHSIRSPLQEAGLTKAEIRELSRARGLPTWDAPSAPCLSSRLPYGLAVTPQRLRQVEQAEEILRGRGLHEFRVRHHDTVARIEVAPAEIEHALGLAQQIAPELCALGFEKVLLDVDGYRSGALNEALVQLGRTDVAGQIAIVAGPLAAARTRAHLLKQNGYRYVAIDLALAPLTS